MIRFSYDAPSKEDHSFEHFSIEGDNTRGYLLLAWDDRAKKPDEDTREMFQKWFVTLGEAMGYCVENFSILKDRWHAPTVAPPVGKFDSTRRRRAGQGGENPKTDGR